MIKKFKIFIQQARVYISVMGFLSGSVATAVLIWCRMTGCGTNPVVKRFIRKYIRVVHKSSKIQLKVNSSNTVWICWWQGSKEIPAVVRMCIESIYRHKGKNHVQIVTKDNYYQFVKFPDHVLAALENNRISMTLFSDILRFTLLAEYGGIWLDATLLVTSDLPNMRSCRWYTCKMKDFPGNKEYVSHYRWSSYCIGGSDRRIFVVMRDLFFEYLKENKYFVEYFLTDYFLDLIYDTDIHCRRLIDQLPENNVGVLELNKKMNFPFDKNVWEKIKHKTIMHKLSWKQKYYPYKNNQITYFGKLIEAYEKGK